MQALEHRSGVDVLVSILGLVAALTLCIAVLGRLWSFLPFFYATVVSMVALRVLGSRRGQLFVAAPLGYRLSLPAGTMVFSGKMHRFELRALPEPLSARVGWWQHAVLSSDTGLESCFVFIRRRTRFAVPTRAAAAAARDARELARINGRGCADGWHAHQLHLRAQREGRTMAAIFLETLGERAAFNVPAIAERIEGDRVHYRFGDGSEATVVQRPARKRRR